MRKAVKAFIGWEIVQQFLVGDLTFERGLPKGDVTRDNSQRRFLAQDGVATSLLRHCFEWLQHCPSIATLCCAKNRRCESSRVTTPLHGATQLNASLYKMN